MPVGPKFRRPDSWVVLLNLHSSFLVRWKQYPLLPFLTQNLWMRPSFIRVLDCLRSRIMLPPPFVWFPPGPNMLPEYSFCNATKCVHLTKLFSTCDRHGCIKALLGSRKCPCQKSGSRWNNIFPQSQTLVPFWSGQIVFQSNPLRGTILVLYLGSSWVLRVWFARSKCRSNPSALRSSCWCIFRQYFLLSSTIVHQFLLPLFSSWHCSCSWKDDNHGYY